MPADIVLAEQLHADVALFVVIHNVDLVLQPIDSDGSDLHLQIQSVTRQIHDKRIAFTLY